MDAKAEPKNETVNPEEVARILKEVAERASRILAQHAQKAVAASLESAVTDELGIARAYMDLYARLLANPAALAAFSVNLMIDYMRLWHASWLRLLGQKVPPVAEPAKNDPRFRDEDWSSNFLFDYIKQSYLIAARHIQNAVAGVEGLPEESKKKVAFFTRQYVDALSPSNFVLTNPQVLRETVATGGQNLLRGLANLLADIERGEGQLRISMTDESAFELGKNVATTPGKVVFQTELAQLIQYEPRTETQYR
ncbi:MAG: class I poly(R)-hydroxyalkanoic acid synthase, partial [Burkholderiales bacterium]|nr:class I poly(R)-hydroxyalkanoic acid synthase [Burkholderiales bacterium]